MRNKDPATTAANIIFIKSAIGIGINKIISMSKTRKITASKKYRVEKGRRAVFLGSNPHSKGEDFSRSGIIMYGPLERMIEIKIIAEGTITATAERIKDIFITFARRFIDELNIFC